MWNIRDFSTHFRWWFQEEFQLLEFVSAIREPAISHLQLVDLAVWVMFLEIFEEASSMLSTQTMPQFHGKHQAGTSASRKYNV